LAEIQYASLVNTVTFPNGDIWACGITTDADSHFHTLVYKTETSLSTGFDQPAQRSRIRIAPNPATNSLSVSLNNADEINYTITNVLGNILKKGTISGTDNLELDVTGYSSGTYFIRIEGASFTEVKKFIISK
ncbi:MAG: T9SS type A sorting domain-containing protein, partial [Flavobacterium sp.]